MATAALPHSPEVAACVRLECTLAMTNIFCGRGRGSSQLCRQVTQAKRDLFSAASHREKKINDKLHILKQSNNQRYKLQNCSNAKRRARPSKTMPRFRVVVIKLQVSVSLLSSNKPAFSLINAQHAVAKVTVPAR